MNRNKQIIYLLQAVLILTALTLIIYKIRVLNYSFSNILPQYNYEVTINMSLQGFGQPVEVKTYLPVSDTRQRISEEINSSGNLKLEIFSDKSGRQGSWFSGNVNGERQISYTFITTSDNIVYQIHDDLLAPERYPKSFDPFLSATPYIQLNHPFIERKFNEIVPETRNMIGILNAIYEYTASLKPMLFKGLTDAVTAAKLSEWSCNGKSRLFIARARKANIPSRLVGGLILNSGTKRTSQQWIEVYIGGHWVPFDALNNHFASIPENYLLLYRGDEVLFKYSKNTNFDYSFKIRKKLVVAQRVLFRSSNPLS